MFALDKNLPMEFQLSSGPAVPQPIFFATLFGKASRLEKFPISHIILTKHLHFIHLEMWDKSFRFFQCSEICIQPVPWIPTYLLCWKQRLPRYLSSKYDLLHDFLIFFLHFCIITFISILLGHSPSSWNQNWNNYL